MTNLLAYTPVLAELSLTLCAVIILLWGAFNPKASATVPVRAGILALLGTGVIVAVGLGNTSLNSSMPVLDGFYHLNFFALLLKAGVILAAVFSLLVAPGYLKREDIARPEYTVLLLLSVVGMMLMLSASNLLMVYMGLELQSLCLYVLAAFRRDAVKSSESGLKYFVLGSLASCLLLYGITLVYGYTGSLEFTQIVKAMAEGAAPEIVTIALVIILAALAFKISAAPFHMWAPDVYEGAPTPVTAFFSIAPKLAALGLLIQVLFGPFAALTAEWKICIAVLSALSMVVGAFGAIGQTNIKRLLAYSSIGHVGYALMALAGGHTVSIESVLIYMAFYIVMSIGAFAVVLLMRRDGRQLENITDLSGISQHHPALAAAMAVLMFSMAGIPPMVGFFTKFYVFMAAINEGMITLPVIGALASVVSAYYYLRIIKVMYFDEPLVPFDRNMEAGLTLTLAASGIITLFGVAGISALSVLAQMAARSLSLP